MAFVQSLGSIAAVSDTGWQPSNSYGSIRFYNRYAYDYATIYATQPNVRTCVEFLGRNIAQLGLHVYRRLSDTDRKRLRDHGLAVTLGRPLPREYKVSRFRLFESMVHDLGIYFNAFLLKVRVPNFGAGIGLLRVPPELVEVKGGLLPTAYEVTIGGLRRVVAPNDIIHVRGYNSQSCVFGLSPLETLRRVLAEEHAAGDHREHFWQNSARKEGVIKRPSTAPTWSPEARDRFLKDWQAQHSGGEGAGGTAILEDDMEWYDTAWSPRESQYLEGRKLTREECAAAYHIPQPFVGILDRATFSNITEQHKNLYQDVLGPWCVMIEEDVELQLLPDFEDTTDVYCEFNIQEKLKGSFEEQVKAMQSAVGRPWLAGDEARGRFNLPSMGGDMARPVLPLNVLVGGQASPRDSAPEETTGSASRSKAAAGEVDPALLQLRERHREKWAQVLSHSFERQRDAVLGKLAGKAKAQAADVWDAERWDRELWADLFALNQATAFVWAEHVGVELDTEIDTSAMLPWLQEHARIQAEEINAATSADIDSALLDGGDQVEAVKTVFAAALSVRSWLEAGDGVHAAANFGSYNAARQGGLRRKTWRVTSSNPRAAHADLDGVSVDIGALFPNGMRWPGDPAGGADNNAGCQCVVTFGR